MAGRIGQFKRNWSDPMACSEVQDAFVQSAGMAGFRTHSTQTQLGTALISLVPGLIRKREKQPDGDRVYMYRFPPLDQCRAHFEKIMKTKIQWP